MTFVIIIVGLVRLYLSVGAVHKSTKMLINLKSIYLNQHTVKFGS